MTRSQLKEFTTELLDGETLSDSLFNSLLDVAQSFIENRRPWVILRAVDETKTALTGDTFLSPKDLPTDFKRWYSRFPIVLVDSQGNEVSRRREIALNQRTLYRNDNGKFYCDYKNRKFYLCGQVSQNLTIHQHYLAQPARVSGDNTWVFAEEFHPILAMLVAVFHREGVNYDPLSAVNAQGVNKQIQMMYSGMEEEDNALALSGVQGEDYGGAYLTERGGSLRNLR